MQQRVMPQVARLAQRLLAFEQARTADRKHFLAEQLVGAESGEDAIAVADRHVDAVAREVGDGVRRLEQDVDVRMPLPESIEPRHQPGDGQRRIDAHRQSPRRVGLPHVLHRSRDPIESLPQIAEPCLGDIGQVELPLVAAEQLQAQVRF